MVVLLFDLNNTIIRGSKEKIRDYEEKLGVDQDAFWNEYRTKYCDDYNRGLFSEEEMYKKMLVALDARRIDVALCKELAGRHRAMIPGMRELLEHLKGKYRMILFTGEGKEFLEEKLEQFSLRQYFPEIYATCDVGLLKFEPALYTKLLSDCDLDPGSCIFIDDLPEFLDIARGFRIKTILFKDADTLREDLASFGIDI